MWPLSVVMDSVEMVSHWTYYVLSRNQPNIMYSASMNFCNSMHASARAHGEPPPLISIQMLFVSLTLLILFFFVAEIKFE